MTRQPLDPATIEACAELVDGFYVEWPNAPTIAARIRSLASEQQGAAPDDKDARIYPCDRCGKMRSKNEGGTVFTVCDACWNEGHRAHEQPPPAPMGTARLRDDRYLLSRVAAIIDDLVGDKHGRILDAIQAHLTDTRATGVGPAKCLRPDCDVTPLPDHKWCAKHEPRLP